MAHFELAAGKVSQAVMHPRLEEIWYVISGHGQMWRALGDSEETEDLKAGLALTIPAQTRFQFRSTGPGPLQAVAITMPPWSSDDDAVAVEGAWEADL